MSVAKKVQRRTARRAKRVRSQFSYDRPRVSVFRSAKNIYVQVIDDATGKTLLASSSLTVSAQGDKKAHAKAVGVDLAKRAQAQNIAEVFFDRGAYRYHGRVAALADGLREGGMVF